VAEAVELSPYLSDFSGEEFVMIHASIFPEGASGRAAGDSEREGALPE
jgi:hypothetical protein